MLASTGVPFAIEAIKGLFGKGMHTSPPTPLASRARRPLPPVARACTSTPTGLSCNLHHPSLKLGSKKQLSSRTCLSRILFCYSGVNNLASHWKVFTPATKRNLSIIPPASSTLMTLGKWGLTGYAAGWRVEKCSTSTPLACLHQKNGFMKGMWSLMFTIGCKSKPFPACGAGTTAFCSWTKGIKGPATRI